VLQKMSVDSAFAGSMNAQVLITTASALLRQAKPIPIRLPRACPIMTSESTRFYAASKAYESDPLGIDDDAHRKFANCKAARIKPGKQCHNLLQIIFRFAENAKHARLDIARSLLALESLIASVSGLILSFGNA